MTKGKKLKQIITNKHWGSLAMGYLKISEQGFLFLKSQKNTGRISLSEGTKSIHLLENGNMVIASIWNIKHGLELAVKALGVMFDGHYWNDHDLLFLFNDLKNKIAQYSLKRDLEMLEILVKKYSDCKFSLKTNHDDVDNNYLRYPEIADIFLDYSFVHDIKRKDINQFLNDIHNIKRAYDLLEAELQHFKSGYKICKKNLDKELLSVSTMKNPGYKK